MTTLRKGKTQMMKLCDVDPTLFAIVVNWIYNKVVRDDKDEQLDVLQNEAAKQIHTRLNESRATLRWLDLVDFAES
jgi:hypothetical protein